MEVSEDVTQESDANISVLKSYISLIRDGADLYLAEHARQPVVGVSAGGSDAVDSAAGVESAVSDRFVCNVARIRDISNMLITFLEHRQGVRLAAVALQDWDIVFGLVKRFAELLGPLFLLFGISSIICYYDKKKLQISGFKRFQVVMDAVDKKVKELEQSLKIIYAWVDKTARDIENLLHEDNWSNTTVREIEKIINEIEGEVNVCYKRLEFAKTLLMELKGTIHTFRQQWLLTNALVFGGAVGIASALYRLEFLGGRTAIVMSAAGSLPLLYTYFQLSAQLDDMMQQIHEKGVRVGELHVELESLAVKLCVMQSRYNARTDRLDETDNEPSI